MTYEFFHLNFQARRLQELAQMVFGVVRTDPNKLDSRFSLTTGGRQAKRLPNISEIKGTRTRLPRPTGLRASQLGNTTCPLLSFSSVNNESLVSSCPTFFLSILKILRINNETEECCIQFYSKNSYDFQLLEDLFGFLSIRDPSPHHENIKTIIINKDVESFDRVILR